MAGARQIRIPGTEDKVDAEVAKLGAAFAKEKSKAKKQTEKSKLAGEALIRKMREKKIQVYRDLDADPPIEINLSDPKFTVKVKTIEQPDAPEDVATQAPAKA